MVFQNLLATPLLGVSLRLSPKEDLFDDFKCVLIESFFEQHFNPSPPNKKTILNHSKRDLSCLEQDLVAFSD